MHYLISHHIETFFPIASNQWGFQPRKSAVSVLIDIVHDWSLALDQRKEVAAVFFDLRKAFDSVPHRPLLDKLTCIGLSVYLIKESASSPVSSGVPQGSVLGPVLFLVYMNDLANGSLSENCFTSLYPDEPLMYKIISDPGDYTSLQSDINSVADWINEHYFSLNPSKCKCMIVSRLR